MKVSERVEFLNYGKQTFSDETNQHFPEVDFIRLKKDDEITIGTNDEKAILILRGEITLKYDDQEVTYSRKNVFDDEASCLHTDAATTVKCVASEDSEVLIQRVKNNATFAVTSYKPQDIRVEHFGAGEFNGSTDRKVKTIFDYKNAPYSNMVMGEVISPGGCWSSYPPHHHDQPEIYFYKYERPEGFGVIFIDDEPYKVENNTLIKIMGGKNHPQSTAPGFPMYFCWMIAHLENNPWTTREIEEKYLWLTEKGV